MRSPECGVLKLDFNIKDGSLVLWPHFFFHFLNETVASACCEHLYSVFVLKSYISLCSLTF